MDGLPDGHRIAILGERVAVFADNRVCDHGHDIEPNRFLVQWGYGRLGGPHPEYKDLPRIMDFKTVGQFKFVDPIAAESTWEEAEQWVLTEEA